MNSQPLAPLRVLHFIGSLDIGGEQTYLISLINAFGPELEHTVAYGYSDLLKERILKPVRFLKLTNRKLTARHWAMYRMCLRFFRVLAGGYDVLIMYSAGLPNLAASLAARWHGVPVLWIPQRAFGNQSKWERLVARNYALHKLTYSLLDGVVALGGYYRYDFVQNWRIPSDKVLLSYIGISLQKFSKNTLKRESLRSRHNLADDATVFGFVGRLHPVKGLHKVLQAFSLLASAAGRSKIVLLVVGDGPERSAYEAMAAQLADCKVVFTGYIPDVEMVMNAIDVYVQATDNPLNGITSIEAMACARPIVTLVSSEDEAAMAADTTDEARNGVLVRLNKLEEDVAKLIPLLNSEVRERLGSASRKMAESTFDLQKHVAEMLLILKQVIASRKPRSGQPEQ